MQRSKQDLHILEETWDQLRQNSVPSSVSKRLGISASRAERLLKSPLDTSEMTYQQLHRLRLISIQRKFDGPLIEAFLEEANASTLDIALVLGLDTKTIVRMQNEERPIEPHLRGYIRLLRKNPDLLKQLLSGDLTVDQI